MGETATHRVTRDRKEKFRGSENDCWVYILKHQAMSVDWAMRYEGWAIEPIPAELPRRPPENPDARPVRTVELPHILVTDELVERMWDAALDAYEDMNMSKDAFRAVLSAVAPELWQAGYNAGFRLGRREGLLGEFKAGS